MKRKHPLAQILFAFVCLISVGLAEDVPAPAVIPAAGVKVQIQIQGGAQIQIQGGGQLQFNAGGVQVQAAATTNAAPPQFGQPPLIFIPGFPFHPFPNPAAIGNATPSYLGVVLDTNPDADENGAEKKNGGVGVLTIIEDSPAAAAGLQEGDRVLTFDGKKATDSTQLREMIRATQPDKAVKLTVRRDGKDVELKAKLAATPAPAAAVQMIARNVPEAVPGVVTFRGSAKPAALNGVVVAGKIGTAQFSLGVAKNPPSDTDTVALRDGNRFAGKITGIAPEKGVTMQREGFPDMDLIAEEITALTFAEREKIEAASAKVHLQLRDGGWFSGDALTMENGTLLLTLPGGQRIEIPREHAQSVTLSNEQAPQIYDGPTGLAGWSAGRTNQGQWEYKDGFLTCISNGPITRNFEQMPDPLDLSFDVVFPPQLQHFSLSLFGGAVNQGSTGTLTIQFSPNQISGHHYDGRRTNQYSVQLQPDADGGLGEKAKTVRYRLLVDRVKGEALIYVGGIKRADWKLSKVNAEDIGKCGATFSFSPSVFSSSDQVRLGRIRLLPWDGKMPWSGVEPTL